MEELKEKEKLIVGDIIIEPNVSGERYIGTAYKIGKLAITLNIDGIKRMYPNTYDEFYRWRTKKPAKAFRIRKNPD